MRIHDRLTLLSLGPRRDLLLFMHGGGGGKVSRGYCPLCMVRLTEKLRADAFEALWICSEPRSNHACYNCERPVLYDSSFLKSF